jgi:hypothetical protein
VPILAFVDTTWRMSCSLTRCVAPGYDPVSGPGTGGAATLGLGYDLVCLDAHNLVPHRPCSLVSPTPRCLASLLALPQSEQAIALPRDLSTAHVPLLNPGGEQLVHGAASDADSLGGFFDGEQHAI